MARERTIDQALDMFDAWEAAALAAERESGPQTLKDVISEIERRVGRKLRVRPVRRKRKTSNAPGRRR